MKRRAFLSLAGAAGTTPLWPAPRAPQGAPAWRFDVDGRLRWRLARGGQVVAAEAAIAVELDGRAVLLTELEGVRRYRGGTREAGVWLVAGRIMDTEISAEFVDDTEWPAITVRVRGLGAQRTVGAVTLLDTGAGAVLPALRAPGAAAWINGWQSWSACRVVAPREADVTGHWQVAILRGTGGRGDRGTEPTGLGLAFGENDTGAGEFQIERGRLVVRSQCRGRPVAYNLAPAVTRLTLVPDADPLAALGRLAAFSVPRPPAEVPSGWCSWYELFGAVTEADVIASLEVAERRFDRAAFQVIQLDDGFQRSCGDWDMNDKFPRGHRWLTERIRAAGFRPGLWLAPFAVAERSGIPALHPSWLLAGANGGGEPHVFDTREDWGGRIYGLDPEVDDAREHLRLLARHAVQQWGYEYLKLDFLYYAAQGPRPPGRRWSPAEAYRNGLRALRAGASGGGAFVLGCGAPLQHAVGLVDGMRIGADVDASVGGIMVGARAAMLRAHYHRRAWLNDPDALVVRPPLTLDEARMWATVTALSGGMTLASDRLERLDDERLAIIQRTMPVLPVSGAALDVAAPERGLAPALVSGDRAVARLPVRWKFRPGDDASWRDPALDDGAWDEIPVGTPWERAGHEGLDGFAWYRATFAAPRVAPRTPLFLELGRIDDCDETFLNGERIGATGDLPPAYRAEWQTYRRYPVPAELVRWGEGEPNVVAVRVYDGGGAGGLWRLTRGEPPSWMLAAVGGEGGDDRWMVAAFNWTDEERRLTAPGLAARLRGTFASYDVWRDRRGPDVAGALTLTVPARSCTCLALRRPRRAAPFVLGTSRHVVQGLLDVTGERWDARRRALTGLSAGLDRRPYAITIAVPAGWHPAACSGSVPCEVTHPHGPGVTGQRTASLTFPEPAERISWEVRF